MIHRGRHRYRSHAGIPHGSTNNLTNKLAFYFQQGVGIGVEEGAVNNWADRSSNGNDLSQTTAENCAALVDGGLDFESGEGDHYDLDSQVAISSQEGFVIFLVYKPESVGSNATILGLNAVTHFLEFQAGGDNIRIKLGAGSQSGDVPLATIAPSSSNLFHNSAGKFLLTLQREAGSTGNLNLWRNGKVVHTSTQHANPGDAEFITLGTRNADRYIDGVVYDIAMIEAGADSDRAIERINAYLSSKHGLIE